ncbi:MAG: ABC transporter permease [Cellulosilyticum sp.]|nr:ABC transporter permease [Cellulosilyticum sp.]
MNIILKYIIRSSMEKKSRTLLIILAIAVSGALFYASLAIKENLEVTYTENFLQSVGNADLMIVPNEDSPSEYFSNQLVRQIEQDTTYIISKITKTLNYKVSIKRNDMLQITGMNLEDYEKNNTLALLEKGDVEPFKGNKIIISKKTAQHYGLEIGDTMPFKIRDRIRNYEVVGIAGGQGMFLDESHMKYGLVPYDKFSAYLDTNKYPNTIYIKLRDESKLDEIMTKLQRIYPKYDIKEPFTQEDLDEKTGMLSMSLLFMTIMVSFMSIFIIYSSFKVIMLQKLPHLGTFRSVGADKSKINQVMFLESGIYGMIGGVLACLIGILISYVLSVVTMPEALKAIGTKVELKISVPKLIVSFLVANGICFISTFFPIIQVSKKPIKEIVLNSNSQKKGHSKYQGVIGIGLLIIGSLAPIYMNMSIGMAVLGMVIAMPAVIIGSIYIMPIVVRMIVAIFTPILQFLFGNVGKIALRNMRKDTSLLNSATLIMIGVTVLLMVSNLTNNLTKELMLSVANIITADVTVSMGEMNDQTVSHLRSYRGVADLEAYNYIEDVPVEELSNNVTEIDGIGGMDYFKMRDVKVEGNQEELIKKLQEGRNVIITKTIQKRNQLKIGDKIEIDFSGFKGKKHEYTIIGVTDTIMQAGSFMMIGQKYMQMDTRNYYYDAVEVLLDGTVDREEIVNQLKKEYKDKSIHISTREEVSEGLHASMAEMTALITGFAMIAVAIGCVGIVNNFIISFIERKRSIAVLKSIGMNKKQIKKMLLIEGAMIGIIGATVGILGGTLSFNITPLFMTLGNVDMPMKHYPNLFLIYILGGLTVAVIAAVSPVRNSSKLNIIEEIKYE